MCKILNENIKEKLCGKCFTYRLIKIISVLNGFYDDIPINVEPNEEISKIILKLKKKYENLSELIIQIRKSLEDLKYDDETINMCLMYVIG